MLIRGVLYGGFISLTACGLSISFMLGFINASHGDFAVLAAYISLLFAWMDINPFISLPIVAIILIGFEILMQKFLLNKFLVTQNFDAMLILTFAIGIVIRNILQICFSADLRSLTMPFLVKSLEIGFIIIPYTYLINFAATIAMFIILHYSLKNTFLGKGLRAVAQDREAAMIQGIKPETAGMVAIVIITITQVVFGVLMGVTYSFNPFAGGQYLLLPFGSIMLSGLGSLKRTFIGGIILGEMIILTGYYLGSIYQLVIVYTIILIILLFKPEGLLTRVK
ncbi:MAG: branched-chain amino acid ABC transporter permease [Candidatus Bathyarchaeia archaeon]